MEYHPDRCALKHSHTKGSIMNTRLIAPIATTAACLFLGSFAVIAAQPAGDLWQVTPQMTMQGIALPMPPQTMCTAREWTRSPVASGPDTSCVNSGFAMSGNTATWKVTCQSPPSTAIGQITRNGNSYTGSIKFTSRDGEMIINLMGNRIGDCDNPS
jgi:hypothetical protein